GGAVGDDLEVSHAAEDAENFSGSAFGVVGSDLGNLFASHDYFERSRISTKQAGSIRRSEVGDQISEAIDFENYGAQTILARGLWTRRSELYVVFNFVAELVRVHHLRQIGGNWGEHIAS